jgi:hypothetical protein
MGRRQHRGERERQSNVVESTAKRDAIEPSKVVEEAEKSPLSNKKPWE